MVLASLPHLTDASHVDGQGAAPCRRTFTFRRVPLARYLESPPVDIPRGVTGVARVI